MELWQLGEALNPYPFTAWALFKFEVRGTWWALLVFPFEIQLESISIPWTIEAGAFPGSDSSKDLSPSPLSMATTLLPLPPKRAQFNPGQTNKVCLFLSSLALGGLLPKFSRKGLWGTFH